MEQGQSAIDVSEAADLTNSVPQNLFADRTSVFLCGSERPLLRWVAYALVANHPGGFLWGHVQMEGEVFEESDVLATPLIPRDRFIPVRPTELKRDELAGNVALGGLMRSDADEETVRRFADFLRLPAQTQELFSRLPQGGAIPVLVLSGGHRLAALYSRAEVAPTLRSILEIGGSMLMTWADAPPAGRQEFDHVLHLKGYEPVNWREATLKVEKGWPSTPLRTGTEIRLADVPLIAKVLAKSM